MAVYPSATKLEFGLGGIFRDILIDEDWCAGCWLLSELESTTAYDISGLGRHGTYVGSGFLRGVPGDLPEGNLGAGLGGEYIEIPDDGDDFVGTNMSLANGRLDIVIRFRLSTNDGTLRALWSKQAGGPTSEGMHVGVQSGALEFFLKVSGVTILNFQRGSGLTDGQTHTVHICYRPDANEARVNIDGVQAGTTVAGSVEPIFTNYPIRIGAFNDGTGTWPSTADVVYAVFQGREGNTGLGAALQAPLPWTDVTAYVRSGPGVHIESGPRGSNLLLDLVAPTGVLQFTMDNRKVLGKWTLGHANAQAGFALGIPVRYTVSYGGDHVQFRGRVIAADPEPGVLGGRGVTISCGDWHHTLALTPISALEAQRNIRSDAAVKLALDQVVGRTPPAVSIGAGSSTFPFALDLATGEQDTVLTEVARIAQTERAYVYVARDGTWTYEGRGERQLETGFDIVLDETMRDLDTELDMDAVTNIMRVTVSPRTVGSGPVVLYQLDPSEEPLAINPGQTRVIEGGYRDPDQSASRVGGTDMIPPVAATDYGFVPTVGGADMSANLRLRARLGGSSFRVELKNVGDQAGYVFLSGDRAFQLRGTPVFYYDPITLERRDRTSVRAAGPRVQSLDLPYETNPDFAEDTANFALAHLATRTRPRATSVTFLANRSAELLTAALTLDIGARVGIVERMTAQDDTDPDTGLPVPYAINGRTLDIGEGGIVLCRWDLVPTSPGGAWALGIAGSSELGETTYLGY